VVRNEHEAAGTNNVEKILSYIKSGSFLAFAFGNDEKREWTIDNRQVIAEGIGLKAGQAVRNS
jgi:hypothetical protein